ncbi:FkbM family methyltransferase [Brevundimonas sp.]|uniref:FkbM family methyltransferase n=1 Tax=Brevundimonas sp. TaxID=1871086 RepID=UPI0025EB672F|nr:FkbM family methyltransferase [Brevundimonas sp.]
MPQFMAFLAERGFAPKTVIDVGVAWGTPEIYGTFPDAYYVLVEPLAEMEPTLQNILKRLKGEYHLCAAGSKNTEAELRVPPQAKDAASLISNPNWGGGDRRTIPVRRLDDLVQGPVEGPLFIKTDCQGADIDVVRGAPKLLEMADLVLMEVQMFKAAGVYDDNQFTQVIRWMADRGFVVYDIVHYLTRPRDGALGQVNLAFVKADGSFRQHHLWA